MTDELSRLARLEQKVQDGNELTERRFDENDSFHVNLSERLGTIEEKQDKILLEMEKGKITAKLAGSLLFTTGAILGWLIKEWHNIKGWL